MTIVIHGVPKAQPRVKAYRRGSHVGVYTPNTAMTLIAGGLIGALIVLLFTFIVSV